MKLFILFSLLSFSVFGCKKNSTEPGDTNPPADTSSWKIVWNDEFNYRGLPDATKWFFETGGHGWGNNELQYYTSNRTENALVYDTALIITARKEDYQGKKFTSVRLNSKLNADWPIYGRFEVRAILPFGTGTWPAIWMLPDVWNYGSKGWPDNGEIDIMEHVGYNHGYIHGSIHTKAYNHRAGTQKSGTVRHNDATVNYHVYAIEWDSTKIDFFVDANKYFTFKNEGLGWEKWPFDKTFHFIFNIAVGGDWGGAQGVDSTIFPQKMYIDYARVYKKNK